MSSRLRVVARLIAALPPILAIVFGVLIARREFTRARGGIAQVLTNELSSSLGVNIAVDGVDASVPGRLVVRGLRIGKEGMGEVLTARRATARYDLGELTRNLSSPASTVSSIRLDGFDLLVERSADGKINLLQLFEGPARPGKPFRGRIVLTGGTVRYIDRAPLSGVKQPMVVAGQGVDGTLDLSLDGRPFRANVARTNVSGPATVRGAFDSSGGLALNVSAKNLSLPFVGRFMVPVKGFSIPKGTATGRFVLTRAPGKRPSMWVDAVANQADLKLPGGLPAITNVDGCVRLAGADAASFDGSASLAGGRWRVEAHAAELAKPVVWANASSRSVNYAALAALAPRGALRGAAVSGSGPVSLRARGPLASLAVSGRAAIPRAAWQGYELSSIRADFDYADGRLVLPAISASAGRGLIAGHGAVLTGKQPRANGQFRFSELSLAAINPKLKGRLWGDADLSLSGGAASGRVVFQGRDLTAFDRQATSAVGDVRLSGSRAKVESLLVATPQGFVTASGTVDLGSARNARLDLRVSGAGITMGDILGRSSTADASGTFDAEGKISGPIASPAFDGRVHGVKVAWGAEAVDVLAGDLYISKSRFSTPGLAVVRGVSEATIRGDVLEPLSPARRLDLSASVKALHLEDLAGYVPALRLIEGAVTGDISRVSGTSRSVRVDFDLSAENLRYQTYSVPQAAIRGSYNQGELAVSSLTAARGPATLEAAGSLRRQGALDFDFRLAALPLEDVLPMVLGQPVPLTASLSLKGHLGGTTPEPEMTATATLDNVNVAGEEIAAATGRLDWRGDVLSVSDTVLSLAGGPVSVDELKVSTAPDASGLISAVVSAGARAGSRGEESVPGAQSIDLGRALVMARTLGLMGRIPNDGLRNTAFSAPEHLQGALDGVVRIQRVGEKTSTVTQASISGLKLYGADLGTASVGFETGPEGYRVRELLLEDGEMQVKASGALTPSDALTADVEGYNLDINRIQNVPALKGVAGKFDISFTATGTLTDPQITGSVQVADGRIGQVDIERFWTGLITADADSVELAETVVAAGPHRLRLSGKLPYSLPKMAFVEDGAVDVLARLDNPDLDVLTLLSPLFDPERTGGEAEGQVAVSGTWPTPKLDGFLRVAKGDIALRGASTVLKDVKIDVQLDGPEVRIGEFRLPSSDGGELALTGGATLDREGWLLGVQARAKDMGLKFRNITGRFDESYNGKVDVDLSAEGPLKKLLLSGEVTAHNGTVGLPGASDEAAGGARLAINPGLDVTLTAGKDLKARGPRMNVGVRGQARLAQTVTNPLLNGHLEVTDGYLLFPGSRFRVVPVGSIDFRYAPPEPNRLSVDIRAETTLSAGANPSRPGASSYRVEMAVRGPLENPRVSFQSYPPGLEASGILAMLGQQAGVGPSGFGGQSFEREVAQLFTANLAPGVLQPVESALAGALGLQEVAFGFGGRDDPLNIQLRRNLFDGVNLIYLRSLAGGQEYDEWKLTYDVTRRIRLTYGESRFRARTIGVEGALSF